MSIPGMPKGYHTLTPYMNVRDAKGFIEFLKQAFAAEVVEIFAGEDGTIFNAEIRVGTSMLMTAEASDGYPSRTGVIYMYVDDPDQVYERALKAGAKPFMPVADQFYGDRCGAVEDQWGHHWWIARRDRQVTPEELRKGKN